MHRAAVKRVQNIKSLALMQVKIEKFEVLHSPILTSLIWHRFQTTETRTKYESLDGEIELLKPISQLFNAIKRRYFACEFVQEFQKKSISEESFL